MIGRRILRHKIYAIINVVGFTIAFTSVLLIYMHVVKEWENRPFSSTCRSDLSGDFEK